MIFAKFAPQPAAIFREKLHNFIDKRSALLGSTIPKEFPARHAARYTQSGYGKCMTLDNVTSFIEWTVIGIERPGQMDRT